MAIDSKSDAMKLLGDFFTQFQVLLTLRVRYHDKAVVVGGGYHSVLLACLGHIILHSWKNCTDHTEENGVLTQKNTKQREGHDSASKEQHYRSLIYRSTFHI